MIADGALEIADADVVIGTHLWNQMPVGYVGVNQATVFAAADMFKLTVRGHGGHGAMPHLRSIRWLRPPTSSTRAKPW